MLHELMSTHAEGTSQSEMKMYSHQGEQNRFRPSTSDEAEAKGHPIIEKSQGYGTDWQAVQTEVISSHHHSSGSLSLTLLETHA
jgi:hypothetical protein